MANNLWASAVQAGTAANKPTVPDVPAGTFAYYYETDTGTTYQATSGASVWTRADLLAPQGTPTAKTGDATLTIAELLTGIITATSSSAVALTLPTGALTDAGVSMAIGQSFEFVVINLGSSSGAVTMTAAASGHTYVGNATQAISTSARYRVRKTAAATFVTYRVS